MIRLTAAAMKPTLQSLLSNRSCAGERKRRMWKIYGDIRTLTAYPESGSNSNWQWNGSRTKKQKSLQEIVTSSRAVSPASHSAKPDEARERVTTASSGLKCLGLFENSGRDGSSVKMLRDFLLSSKGWYSNKSWLTWKVKVTRSNVSLYQLSPSMRRIEGIESGLLPTAQATR